MRNILGIFLAALVVFALPAHAALDNANNKNVNEIALGALSVAGDVYGLYIPEKAVVTGVYVVDSAALAASDTNYVTAKLMAGTVELASYDSRAANQGALVANTPKAANMILKAPVVPAGTYLKVTFAKGGTGAFTGGKVFVQWYEK